MSALIELAVQHWELVLANKECLKIAECDLDRIEPVLRDEINKKNGVLSRVPFMPRSVVDEAKLGYPIDFLRLLRGDPLSIFSKIGKHRCHYFSTCSTYSESCNIPKIVHQIPSLPDCYVHGNTLEDSIINEFILHWKEGRRVVITY